MNTEDIERNNVLYQWCKQHPNFDWTNYMNPNLNKSHYFENKLIEKAFKKNIFKKIYQWLIKDL